MDVRIISFKYSVFLLLLLFMVVPVSGFAEELTEPKIGEAAPAFNLETLQGDKLALVELLGKFVVIHFATSWWPFCNAEAPHLEALWKEYMDKDVQVLIIDVLESKEVTAKWAGKRGFTFPVLMDAMGEVAASYAPLDLLPDLSRSEVVIGSNLIIDNKGKIQFFDLLNTTSFDAKLIKLQARLKELLAEK
jgi:peroxiredoxin